MADTELKQRYPDADTLRKAIKSLENKEVLTNDETNTLKELYAFRSKYYLNNKLAWDSVLEMYSKCYNYVGNIND